MYHFLRKSAFALFKSIYKFEIDGVENIPKEGPVILACNHINNLDPFCIAFAVDRQIFYMAKEEIFKIPIINKIARSLGVFPVKRGGGDRKAIRTAIQILESGNILGIFPEGTRSKTGVLGKGHVGVGIFALKTNAVVIPIAIKSTFKPFSKIKIIYGKPIDTSSTNDAAEVTDKIMNAISVLLKK